MKRVIALFTCVVSLYCASITLLNDSQFKLTAVIYNAAGQKEGSQQLHPGQTFMWYGGNFYDPFKEQLNQPYAPYTVVWQCNEHGPSNKKGSKKKDRYTSEFGTWTNVSVGSTVTAMGSPLGTKSCTVPKHDKKDKRPAPSHKNSQDSGFNNFSNDGGQSWTNDGQ